MNIYRIISDLKKELNRVKNNCQTIGFVPTMGALHEGHLSLVKRSKKENNITVVSIFVNPEQFNNPNDLKFYPRNENTDLEILKNEKCDIVFLPEVKEMYPEKDNRVFNFGKLDKVMEGAFRPGHFSGVAKIVSKLFEIVKPDNAYFGKKDFQQVAVIKYLTKKHFKKSGINIITGDTIREHDGLAMSSRNVKLNKKQRKAAALISQTLLKYLKLNSDFNTTEIKKTVINTINKNKYLQVEYFDIVDNETLQSIKNKKIDTGMTACIAVYSGNVRLIDNISV